MRHKTASDSTAKPEEGSLDSTEELIRVRAHQLYEERGCEDGHGLDDWLQAEAEIVGKKPMRPTHTHDGRMLRLLTLIDEYTRKYLAIRVARRLNSYDLIETLADVMLVQGVPKPIRSEWTRVYCGKTAEVAVGGGSEDAVHRAGQPLGERVL
jgi:DUF2934 family protein